MVSGSVVPEQLAIPRRIETRLSSFEHPLLKLEMLNDLRESILRVELLFGAPQDIEWCFDAQGTFWLLQSRPITTLSNEYITVSERQELSIHINKDILSSKNTMESMSFVPTALTWTTFSEVIDSALQQRYQQKQIDYYKFCGENRSFYELRQGHVYQNVTLTCELNREEFGIDFISSAEEFGLDSTSLAQLLLSSRQSKASTPGSVSGSFYLLKTLWSSGTVAAAASSHIERELEYCLAERKRLRHALPGFEAIEDIHSSFEVLLDRFKGLATTYIDVTINASVFEAAISSFLGSENKHLLAPLTSNVGGVFTSKQTRELRRLAKEIELLLPLKKEELSSLLDKTKTDSSSGLKDTAKVIEEFLDMFGFRAETELEVSSPRWWDSAARFLDMIQLLNSNKDPGAAALPTEPPVKDKEAIIYSMSSFMTRPVLRWAVNQLNDLMRLRENGKYVVVYFIALSRMIVTEAGKRLAKSGLLAKEEDVFNLPINDFRQLFGGLLAGLSDIKRCIKGNAELRRRWLRGRCHSEIIGFKPVESKKRAPAGQASTFGNNLSPASLFIFLLISRCPSWYGGKSRNCGGNCASNSR